MLPEQSTGALLTEPTGLERQAASWTLKERPSHRVIKVIIENHRSSNHTGIRNIIHDNIAIIVIVIVRILIKIAMLMIQILALWLRLSGSCYLMVQAALHLQRPTASKGNGRENTWPKHLGGSAFRIWV